MELKQKATNILDWILITLGWALILFSCIVLINTLPPPRYRDPSINALLTHPDSLALVGTIGVIIGFNFPSIFACLLGIAASIGKNPKGRVLILASLTVFLVNSAILFLPSSELANANINRSIVTTIPQSEFTVIFPYPVKKKVVSVAGFESIAFETEGSESIPSLRAEFIQDQDLVAVYRSNNFRTVLENHARLAGLSLPAITQTEDRLGKVGTYSGFKKVGDVTIRIYGKMVIGESSAINCLVVEDIDTFPSEVAVNFLASIKRK